MNHIDFSHFHITYYNNKRFMANNFNPTINSFDGDSQLIKFFFNQITELAKLNKWDDTKTIFFLKSKLSGPALSFFIQSECSTPGQTFDQIKNAFFEYFVNESPQASILDLTSFHILPDETIKSVAHRLNILIHKVYPNVLDKDSLQQIKKTHLIQALPIMIRTKILEEKIDTYDQIVARAHELQSIHATALTHQSSHLSKFDELSKQINFISEKLNHINVSKNDEKPHIDQSESSRDKMFSRSQYIKAHYKKRSPQHKFSRHNDSSNSFSNRDSFRHHNRRFTSYRNSRPFQNKQEFRNRGNSFNSFDANKRSSLPTCPYCGKNHLMSKCWQFLKMMKNNNQNASNLNPNASSFHPHLNGMSR